MEYKGLYPYKIDYQYPGRPLASVKLDYSPRRELTQVRGWDNRTYRLDYKKGRLKTIQKGRDQLSYHYSKMSHRLKRVQLKRGKRKYDWVLQSKSSPLDEGAQVADFLNGLYRTIGPVYRDSSILQGVI